MIQKTYKITSKAKFKKWLDEIKESSEYKKSNTILVKGVTSHFHADEIEEARQLFKETLPKAKMTGMSLTTFGRKNFENVAENSTRFYQKYIVLTCCYFENSEVTIIECGNEIFETGEVTAYLRGKLEQIDNIKAVEVLIAGKARYVPSLIEDISEGYEEVPFCGAEAGIIEFKEDKEVKYHDFQKNYTASNTMQYILGDRIHTDGVVLTVYSGENLYAYSEYHLGWKPLGKEMKITKAVGNTCIAEIDYMPATHVYKKYLNVEPDRFFLLNVCEFPLMVIRNKCPIARIPPMYDEKGWLYCGADIYEGEKIRLSYGNPQEVLSETYESSERMLKFGPEAVFLYICGSRNIFLGNASKEEIEDYLRFHSNTAPSHGNAEIYRYRNQGGMLNGAIISLGLRESSEPVKLECAGGVCQSVKKVPSHAIPLIDRLATFLKATTDELKELLNIVQESNHKLRKMAKQAESSSKAKSLFLSNMSHEIRTPINAILGMNEMILRESKDPAIIEYAENIHNAGNSLLGIVNDILDFSKIEAGKMEIIPVEYALSSLLNDLVNMIQKRAKDKGLEFIVDADPNLPTILFGDEIRIKQIATNILTNAVKYTEKGSVKLAVGFENLSADNVKLKFTVKDTGIGIKKEDIHKLFSAFERIEEQRNRKIEGTGLGMNITQQLLKLMGSKLEVESVYGEGSIFSFEINQKVMNAQAIGNFEDNYRNTIAQHKEYHEKFTAPKAKILVVDDTVMNLTVVKGLLKQTKIQIFTAESGYECLHLVTKQRYDIIFLDHRMPGIDGIETLHRMRALPNSLNRETPVISLTANAVSGARSQYMKAGFQNYLTKPINSSALELMLMHYLPKDKVIISKSNEETNVNEEQKLPDWLKYIDGLNTFEGIVHCGGIDSYIDALTVFAQSISHGVNEIKTFYDNEDWKNYTTKVHALKSSARVVGAKELSERAKRLEDAGNSGYINEIKECNDQLLELYASYETKLSPLLKIEDDTDKSLIDERELAEAFETMKEIASTFDYDSLMFVIQSLNDYKLPEDKNKVFNEIKTAATNLDWDKINALLKNID